MMESVSRYGVLTPAIVRPRSAGSYEIISGHRRKHASETAGLEVIPAIVRDMDDDAATILMVDSNIQREDILPSEKAQAYKMKLEAVKRQGARTDLTSPQVAAKFRADDEVSRPPSWLFLFSCWAWVKVGTVCSLSMASIMRACSSGFK